MSPPSPKRMIRLHWTLLLALAAVAATWFVVPGAWRWATRAASSWDAGVVLFLVLALAKIMRTRSADEIRQRAEDLDDAGDAVLPLSLLALVAAVVVVIGEAASAPDGGDWTTAALVLLTVALSWVFIHLIFAEHYAHGFYGPAQTASGRPKKGDRGGLIFPGEEQPDYWDFIHFSLVIGVASQTADIQIADRRLRRIASLQSVTAFVFNTVILALAVNFAVNLLGK